MGNYTENLFKKKKGVLSKRIDIPLLDIVDKTNPGLRDSDPTPTIAVGVDVSIPRLVKCAIIDREGVLRSGFRTHSELRQSLGYEKPYEERRNDKHGFITSDGNFVNRRDASIVGLRSGQVHSGIRDLLSCDIDW
jgi:hypothetical protein